jgi:predicted dehydrogenase
MKVCFIGACGHSKQALKILRLRDNVTICGVAAGSAHEVSTQKLDPNAQFYEDYRTMLEKTKPELAIISPVFGLTSEIITECAERGIAIFSEKPVATTLAELARVEHAIKDSGVRFCAMHYLRYNPAFYEGARMVKNGQIGELRMITAQKSYRYGTRPSWYADRSLYGGTIPWVGIHAIDWIYHFSGKKFLSVSAESVGDSPEMAALCKFRLEDGVIASANLDYYRPPTAPTHGDDRIRCVGTKGILEIREGTIHVINEQGVQGIIPTNAPELFEEFLNGNEPISPEEIFYLTRVALLARESADTKKEIKIEN